MLLVVLTSWLERCEREAIAYLIEENRLLRRQLGGRRPRFTDDERRRLAVRTHWGAITGADFFTTGVWTWRGLVTFYTVFVMDLASRCVQIVGSTPYRTPSNSVALFRWSRRARPFAENRGVRLG
jgi:hypothetical protein